MSELRTEFSLPKIGDYQAYNATLADQILSSLRNPNAVTESNQAAAAQRGQVTPCQVGLPDCHIENRDKAAESRNPSQNPALQEQVKLLLKQQEEDLKAADNRLAAAKEGFGKATGLFTTMGIYATAARVLEESSAALPRPLAFAAKVLPAVVLGGAVNNENSGRNLYDPAGYIENSGFAAVNSLTRNYVLFAGLSMGESYEAGAIPYLRYKASLSHAGEIQAELDKLNKN